MTVIRGHITDSNTADSEYTIPYSNFMTPTAHKMSDGITFSSGPFVCACILSCRRRRSPTGLPSTSRSVLFCVNVRQQNEVPRVSCSRTQAVGEMAKFRE